MNKNESTKKHMWMRVGVQLDLNEEEYNLFLKNFRNGGEGYEAAESFLAEKLKFENPDVELSGETYFPDSMYLEDKMEEGFYSNVEELSFLF